MRCDERLSEASLNRYMQAQVQNLLRGVVGVLLLGTLAFAMRHATADDPVPPPPPLPAEEQTPAPADTYLEPDITITTKKDATHYEYRINGRLYMIKVVPAKGPPYYLIDPDGSGEWRRADGPDTAPPMWVLKRF